MASSNRHFPFRLCPDRILPSFRRWISVAMFLRLNFFSFDEHDSFSSYISIDSICCSLALPTTSLFTGFNRYLG